MQYTTDNPLRVIELFCGYGSQRLALERLKRHFPAFDYRVVAVSEIEPTAIEAYTALHGDCPNLGDVTQIDWAAAPACDLLTYSFPCTDISSAGQQKGLAEGSGTASSLLWEVQKAIKALHPAWLLMENVPALLSKKFLPYFHEWTRFLEGEGYTNHTAVLGAQDFGVPQHRRRVFCVSNSGGAPFFFPEPFPLTKRLKDVLEDDVDESFYLSDERVQGLIASTLKTARQGQRLRVQAKDT